jgi:hypothetical protein
MKPSDIIFKEITDNSNAESIEDMLLDPRCTLKASTLTHLASDYVLKGIWTRVYKKNRKGRVVQAYITSKKKK